LKWAIADMGEIRNASKMSVTPRGHTENIDLVTR
jgi:hypothetical protein